MIAPNLEQQIRDMVSGEISVRKMDDSTYAVGVPLTFPDGDRCRVFVSHTANNRWTVRDRGTASMRASYVADVDVLSSAYVDRFRKIIALHGLSEENGEVFRDDADDLGEAVFSMAQASIDIVHLARMPRARIADKESKFAVTLDRIVKRVVGTRAVPEWHNPDKDPDKLYPVSYWIDGAVRPVLLFAAHSRLSCMHATMSCLFHKTYSNFSSLAIYESEKEIPTKESQRLDDAVDEHFRSLKQQDAIEESISRLTTAREP